MSSIFISIQLNSNRPKNLVDLLNNLEKTTTEPSTIEVIVHFDLSDIKIKDVLQQESKNRKVKIKYISTDLVEDYGTLWKPLNLILKETDNNAYFILNISDEIRFKTYGWDQELRKYVNYYTDNIFRLRLSKYKYRNYFDFWEAGFAPDSICFYTKKWMELSGDWNPCLGPDSFQQSVSYYLMMSDRFSQDKLNRDIAINNINIIGEGAGRGDDEISHYRLIKICTKAWFILMSHKFQEEAKRRAMRMKAHILSVKYKSEYIEDKNKKRFYLINQGKKDYKNSISYKINFLYITIINLIRIPSYTYYGGGGGNKNSSYISVIFVIACNFKNGEYLIYRLLKVRNYIYKLTNYIIELAVKLAVKLAKKFILTNVFKLVIIRLKNNLFKIRYKNIAPYLLDQLLINDDFQDNTRISLIISTKNVKNLKAIIGNIEHTSQDSKLIELIIKIDGDDYEIINYLESLKDKTKLLIKYLSEDNLSSYKDTTNQFSHYLKIVNKRTDFIAMISDEIRFESNDWISVICNYKNYYDDNIFRIKLSKNKFFNYTDEWECGLATNGVTFYSRNWILLQDTLNLFSGSEIFQSLVSYYMMVAIKFSHNQYHRDVVDPFLVFSGEKPIAGIHGCISERSTIKNCRDWFGLFSYKNLSNAKKNASLLVTYIEYAKLIKQNRFSSLKLLDDGRNFIISSGDIINFKIFYKSSKIKILLINITRASFYHYYSGGGKILLNENPLNGLRLIINSYFPLIGSLLRINIKQP